MTVGVKSALSGPWLASRLGIDPVALDIRRRSAELLASRAPGSPDWLYPSWQFEDDWHVRPHVERVLDEARRAGLTQPQLEQLLHRRVGLAGRRRLLDLLVDGDDGPVVSAIRAGR